MTRRPVFGVLSPSDITFQSSQHGCTFGRVPTWITVIGHGKRCLARPFIGRHSWPGALPYPNCDGSCGSGLCSQCINGQYSLALVRRPSSVSRFVLSVQIATTAASRRTTECIGETHTRKPNQKENQRGILAAIFFIAAIFQ